MHFFYIKPKREFICLREPAITLVLLNMSSEPSGQELTACCYRPTILSDLRIKTMHNTKKQFKIKKLLFLKTQVRL